MGDPNAPFRRLMTEFVVQQQYAVDAPLVAWLGIGETHPQFARRVKVIRTRAPKARILAVVPFGYKVPESAEAVEFPEKLFKLLHPQRPKRYRICDGGRGSGKSHAFATAVILYVLANDKARVLCCREIMKSLRESSQHLLISKIDALKLGAWFDVTDREITCKATGSEIIFAGLFVNLNSLKSLEDVSLVWGEEAESISAKSFEILPPTIRSPKSEIWLSLNLDSPDAPVMRYIDGERTDVSHLHVDYRDNPWFASCALEVERAYLEKVDDDAYQHIWLGKVRRVSDAIIFNRKWIAEEFEPRPEWSRYVGLDFGFSNDPSAAIEVFVADRRLYIHREFWALHVELDSLSAAIENCIPGSRYHSIKCDSSRPESISYLQRHGHGSAIAADKWPGSILDGIAHIRSYECIVIHPSCTRTIDEFKNYSYCIDKITGLPLTEPEDRNNHLIDALRYALSDLIRLGGNSANVLTAWYRSQNSSTGQAIVKDRSATAAVLLSEGSSRPKSLVALWRSAGAKVESL